MIGFFVFLLSSVCLPGSSITWQHVWLFYYRNITVFLSGSSDVLSLTAVLSSHRRCSVFHHFHRISNCFYSTAKRWCWILNTVKGWWLIPGWRECFPPSAVSSPPWFLHRCPTEQANLSSPVFPKSLLYLLSIHIVSSPASHSSSPALLNPLPSLL